MFDLRRVLHGRKQALLLLLCCLLAMIAVAGACLLLLSSKKDSVPASSANTTTATSSEAGATAPNSVTETVPDETPAEPDATPEPALTPEEVASAETATRIEEVTARMSELCTREAPQVTDPATWNAAGKELLESLEADPHYQSGGITLDATEKYPYLIAVNRDASTVTVYVPDDDNRYTVPFAAFICSGGKDTPLGYFNTPINYDWRLLSGPCYGQYATRIWDAYLFHSVPYYTQHQDDLEYDQYNMLGTPASLGCIRLEVCDVKWIYDNCPIGTPVIIYDDAENPGPMGKPGTIYTDPSDEAMRGWDPTDPNPENPWDDKYLDGTAIRSDAAWQQWQDAKADGRWADSLNATNLQGYSTDSSVEGTRG